jgi:hypothetical protein
VDDSAVDTGAESIESTFPSSRLTMTVSWPVRLLDR